jgi:uncharacterized RDD family membrane protein YckC
MWKVFLKNCGELAQCACIWAGCIWLCELSGWWWYQDAVRAAMTKYPGNQSGGGPWGPFLCYYVAPVIGLYGVFVTARSFNAMKA